jgi:hypothetical protein
MTNSRDLANLGGGFIQAGGGVQRSVESKLKDVVSVKDFGAVGDGVTNDTAAIQATLNAASPASTTVLFPPGTYVVSSTLTAGNSTITGPGATIKYTGSSNLFGAVSAFNISFDGPGKATTSIGVLALTGYSNTFENCNFTNFGTAIKLSGSGQKIFQSYFGICGVGIHVVHYPATSEPTTTFTSEKNWFEYCNKGLWFDSSGVAGGGGHISSVSKDDIFQLNTGAALVLNKHNFPFTLINPHTEQNCITPGHKAFEFIESNVSWIGGYQAGTEVNSIDALTRVAKYNHNLTYTKDYSIYDNTGSRHLVFSPGVTSIDANSAVNKVSFIGGGYGSTNTARFDMQGGRGDNGFAYGSFIASERSNTYGNGVNLNIGTITAGSPDVYTNWLTLNFAGTFHPATDNTQNLGGAPVRWATIYAGTGTINTSDEREKQDIENLSDAEFRVATALKGLVKKYRFKDAVQAKGDDARIHVGVIAQDVADAFIQEGLDPTRYGIFCKDTYYTLDGVFIVIEEDEPIPDGAIQVERLGIRYEELLAFIIAAL